MLRFAPESVNDVDCEKRAFVIVKIEKLDFAIGEFTESLMLPL